MYDESDEDEDGDVSMDGAPALVQAKPKPAPEVDDDGFTKVVGRRRNIKIAESSLSVKLLIHTASGR